MNIWVKRMHFKAILCTVLIELSLDIVVVNRRLGVNSPAKRSVYLRDRSVEIVVHAAFDRIHWPKLAISPSHSILTLG